MRKPSHLLWALSFASVTCFSAPEASFGQDRLACATPSFSLTHQQPHTGPLLPQLSYDLGEEGSTTLNVVVGGDGRARDVTVLTSSGYRRLDEATMADIKKNWRWDPFTGPCAANGVTTKVRVVLSSNSPRRDYGFRRVFATGEDYPAAARARNEEGVAVVGVEVSELGVAANARIVQGTDFKDLDEKAVQMVSRMKFQPVMVDGVAARSTVSIKVFFVLEGPPKSAAAAAR